MKKISILISLFFAFMLLNSCVKKPEEQILGTWKITSVESTANMTEADIELFKSSIEEQKQMLSYTFSESSMMMTYGDEETEWMWAIESNGDSLNLLINTEERSSKFLINELTQDELVWEENVYDEYIVTTTLSKVEKKK